MSKRHKRPARKVKLPTDRTGEPIHVGDVLEWKDGSRLMVESLTYYGRQLDALGFRWVAEGLDEGEYADNLGASTIIRRTVEK